MRRKEERAGKVFDQRMNPGEQVNRSITGEWQDELIDSAERYFNPQPSSASDARRNQVKLIFSGTKFDIANYS